MAKFYAKAPNGDDAVLSISIQNFTQSLQQNGWCKLPNGLIIQWFNMTAAYSEVWQPYNIAITKFQLIVGTIIANNTPKNYFSAFHATNDGFICCTSPAATTNVYILGQ